MSKGPLQLDSLFITHGRAKMELSLTGAATRTTNRELANCVISKYPSICAHACVNSKGSHFGDVIAHTSVPHLFEHITIEEQLAQTKGLQNSEALISSHFVGSTELSKDRKNATVEISFFDDIICVRAIHSALNTVNSLLLYAI